ncbi:MAG: aminoacyl-tRNA hydrolase [Clostridiales bacterium]|nr:aminoacyl-tRNA hydrolase [Candidatus Apopatousia equi]
MILLVGLGNPEKKYDRTYHNVGFMALDYLCDEFDIELTKHKCKSVIFEGNIMGQKVVIAKPQTYMNLSGEAVVELTSSYKPDKTLIIYDDIDLEKGDLRYRDKGSAGTHNGMRNIISLMGTENINRLRIGTKPEEKPYNLADYVLSKIDTESLEKIDTALTKAVELIKEYINS